MFYLVLLPEHIKELLRYILIFGFTQHLATADSGLVQRFVLLTFLNLSATALGEGMCLGVCFKIPLI
jgi:hypothetical protein